MTRAQVIVSDIDLLQLSAGVRVLEIEAKEEAPEKAPEEFSQEASNNSEEDASAD
jgi:exoribonuclease-2